MAKSIIFNTEDQKAVRDKIKSGIDQLSHAVRMTLGPSGRVVMFEREFGDPVITKDGVTVAREVELSDPFENMAASMVRQAAARTATQAGDGTTTATIYAAAIYNAGIKRIEAGANAQSVRSGIDHAVAGIIDELKIMAKPVIELDQIKQVAVCSSNQDLEIGSIIAEAMDQVGTDGVVTIEEGSSLTTSVSVIDGLQFQRGYVSPQFATNPESLKCEYDDPAILISADRIDNLKTLLYLLQFSVKELSGRPLVIIAEEFSDDCVSALILNRLKGQLSIVAVKAPGYGDRRRQTLEDIAIATGTTVLSKDSAAGLTNIKTQYLGTCKKISIDRDSTTILEGGGEPANVVARIELLRSQLQSVTGGFDMERIQERLARLSGGVARISVGGATEVEVREKKDRVDDALHACKAAIEEGILPGGAVAAVKAASGISADSINCDFNIGINIILDAIEAPLRQIAINTGTDHGVVVDKVKTSGEENFGFDAAKKIYGDMIKFGIIVPTKVERVALQNAASVAGLLLTTDCMISTVREKQEQPMGPFPSLG